MQHDVDKEGNGLCALDYISNLYIHYQQIVSHSVYTKNTSPRKLIKHNDCLDP